MNARALFVVAVLAFSGCSRVSTGGTPFLPQARDVASASVLIVRVTVDRAERLPHFLSPSAKGMTVDINGPTKVQKTVGLTVNAAGCKSKLMTQLCVLRVANLASCPSQRPCYTATIRTYDAFAKNHIPKDAHLLSAIEGLKFNVESGTTLVPVVLDGVPASVAFIPSTDSILTGTQKAGFIFPKCVTRAQTVTLLGVDADGNYIVGPGAPSTSLTSGNPSQLRIVKGKSNVFKLKPPADPAYAYGNQRVVLNAVATPAERKLGKRVVSHVDVSYSGDICGHITEFAIPTAGAGPFEVTSGPDGSLWFTEAEGNKIGRITLNGSFKEFPIPTSASGSSGIAAGPDGNLWFTETSGNKIGRVTTSGAFDEFTIPTATSGPLDVTVGPDHNLWFTELFGNKIGRISTSGTIEDFAIPTAASSPRGITVGPDGNIWFTECVGNKIAYADTAGNITEFPVSAGGPTGITSGPSEKLWVTQHNGNEVIAATTGGVTTQQFPVPAGGGTPTHVIVGPDGALWFTEQGFDHIGRFTPLGEFTNFALSTGADPFGITVGPDGAIWFTEFDGDKIGRLR